MNEKIKQLALEAGIGFTLWDDSGRPMIDNYTPEERLQKFAELIVSDIVRAIRGLQQDAQIEGLMNIAETCDTIAGLIEIDYGVSND